MNLDLFESISPPSLLPFEFPSKEGYEVAWEEKFNGFRLIVPNGEIFYSENYFSKKLSDRSLEYFLENDCKNKINREISEDDFHSINFNNINWKQDSINMFGKNIPLPRYTSWYGDQGKNYSYSGINSNPNNWNKGLKFIKNKVERVSQTSFNSVLLNWYRDGEDYLNWHSDNEKELGKRPIIASVSFGETRDFMLRKKDKAIKIKIPLKHGSLLIMGGDLQNFWEHSVPKRKKVKNDRVNLTFRYIK